MNTNPKESSYWPEFVEWANGNGVGLEHEEDWFSWWECFYAGITAVSDWIESVLNRKEEQ